MITYGILILTIVFSVYTMDKPDLKYKYMFNPYEIYHAKQHYRFLSHAFIHGDYIHLAFNMFALYMFGPLIEQKIYPILLGTETEQNFKMGSLCYVLLYTGGIYASSVFEFFKHKHDKGYNSLGASGAINAIIFSFILCMPTQELAFFFIPMPAWVFGVLYLGITFYLSKRKSGNYSADIIGHEAHFWGAIFGVVFTGSLNPELFANFITKILA